jgi:hypothetical protein
MLKLFHMYRNLLLYYLNAYGIEGNFISALFVTIASICVTELQIQSDRKE